jgi:hypothetical protein
MTSLDEFKHDFKKKQWAVLYLHNWDADGGVYPEIHGVYDDEQTAIDNVKAMVNPSQYHIRIVYSITRKSP